ncbi:hypothetical protein IV203_016332 [Nitzschia inconspicua]|nr:hypothetical protein IV203_016332 [Nitzschia inconspicua]
MRKSNVLQHNSNDTSLGATMNFIYNSSFCSIVLFLLILTCSLVHAIEYVMVGVSGGLQEGFPEHDRMDYHSGLDDEVPAVFLGRALVRGYKSYLDVMQPTHRQYSTEPELSLINPNVIATGCYHHANEYWIYLVDTRQFATILLNEPRFLSIAADLGLVDLQAEETGPLVKFIAQHEIRKQKKSDLDYIAFPIVTGAWYNPSSHVPAPVLYTKEDGTQVTNFPQSLATWAGVIDGTECSARTDDECFDFLAAGEASKFFFDSINKAIRHAEVHRPSLAQAMADGPPFSCEKKARFGVSKETARINYPFTPQEFRSMLQNGGYEIDFQASQVTKVA